MEGSSIMMLERFTCLQLEEMAKIPGTEGRNAQYVLGKRLIEGSWLYPDEPANKKKGLTWLRDNVVKEHVPSKEYISIYIYIYI